LPADGVQQVGIIHIYSKPVFLVNHIGVSMDQARKILGFSLCDWNYPRRRADDALLR
jgi:hypothetical protein